MDNVIEVVFIIVISLILFVLLICRLAESIKRWRSHNNKESNQNSESAVSISMPAPEWTSGNQLPTRTPESVYSPQDTDPTNSSRIQNCHQSLRADLPPEIILMPSQQIINPDAECDNPPSYESLFTCECSNSLSPISGASKLDLTLDSGWSIVDHVNWMYRKLEDSVIWMFYKMDELM